MTDWYSVYGINDEQADCLTRLDTLRSEDPVSWALVQGLKTSASIATHITWPHEWVLGTLRELKRKGWVWESEGPRSIYWELTNETHCADLARWVATQRRQGGLFRRSNRNDE